MARAGWSGPRFLAVKAWLLGIRVVESEPHYLAIRLPRWMDDPVTKRKIATSLTQRALAAGKQVRMQVDGRVIRCWRLDGPQDTPHDA